MAWRELIPNDAKKTLDTLIDRKRKLETFKSRAAFCALLCLFCFLLFAIAYYRNIGTLHGSFASLYEGIVGSSFLLFLLSVFIVSFVYLYVLAKEIDKAKKKYDTLREETIDKFDTTWLKSINFETRSEISIEMNSYDINIDYKG
ncbi:DUF2663 family protein [Paenibacillus glycanilyticus]|uniref:DUF2663 family protein n=1 Tax=Paenibacillus glycanilyticus TaxID=126569 RepID=A0ABQ6GA15_9BACL|nr:DUF2663 family protein [Paenibacillus glycanilyticus]GLX67753.1 hypothetical protein MU1_20980 [Paenibacillus glycanilyticus]